MSLFGKKKRSLDDILRDIQALSEEEQAQLRAKMQGEPVNEAEPVSEETAPEAEAQTEEPAPEAEASEGETVPEAEETSATEEAPAEEETVEAEPEQAEEAVPTAPEEPLTTPQTEEQQSGNSDELYAALQAKYDSLESQFKEMQGTLEKIVAKQDNQNFGYSPKANFDEDGTSSRMDSVLNGYAPRRAEQYK